MGAVLVAVVLLPALAGGFAALVGPARGRLAGRVGVLAAGASAIGTVLLLARVTATGPVSAVWTRPDGRLLAGIAVDRMTVVLLLLVCGVSTLVQGFALRYLAGDRRASWFVAGTGVTTSASAGLMSAATLVGLATGWSLAGLGLVLLLATYPQLPAARDGVRRAARAFLIGDAALWTAVAVATVRWGTLDLRHLDARGLPGAAGVSALLGVLVVTAALSRSAQVPFHGWLPTTLAAPTPVSALLHAGVINAGGVLLIRLAPLSSGSRLALGLAFVAGAVTAIHGTLLMRTRPDVKGALAHSTMGQMGFMIMTCGLGLYAAAVVHLVLHGMYKAGLFLASGTAINTQLATAAAPPAPRPAATTRVAVTATAVLLPGLLLGGAVGVLHPTLGGHTGAAALLLFAWATATAATLGWLRRHATPGGAIAVILTLAAALTGYVAFVDTADRWLAPALPAGAVTLPGTGWLLVAAFAALALAGLLGHPATARAGRVQRRLYVLALGAGHAPPPARPAPAGVRLAGSAVRGSTQPLQAAA